MDYQKTYSDYDQSRFLAAIIFLCDHHNIDFDQIIQLVKNAAPAYDEGLGVVVNNQIRRLKDVRGILDD